LTDGLGTTRCEMTANPFDFELLRGRYCRRKTTLSPFRHTPASARCGAPTLKAR
jgi:hypothetical protein